MQKEFGNTPLNYNRNVNECISHFQVSTNCRTNRSIINHINRLVSHLRNERISPRHSRQVQGLPKQKETWKYHSCSTNKSVCLSANASTGFYELSWSLIHCKVNYGHIVHERDKTTHRSSSW